MSVWIAFCEGRLCVCVFPFFFFLDARRLHGVLRTMHCLGDTLHCLVGLVHCSRDPQPLYLEKKILKMGFMVLFTHLKIIFYNIFSF